jgi:hypothetical protein
MIKNNSILTSDSKVFELSNYYYSPDTIVAGEYLTSLYSFISYKTPWDETLLTSNVSDTIVTKKIAAIEDSNTIFIANDNSLSDFFVGMKVVSDYLPANSYVTSLNENNLSLYINNKSANNYFGNAKFIGLNQTYLVTINEKNSSLPLSNVANFYNDYSLFVDVTNEVGGLTYTRNITEYDPETRTIKVDVPFSDYPPLTTFSTLKIFNDNNNPPKPKDTVKYIRQVHKDIIYFKKITEDDMSPVIQRVNWNAGTVYDYYSEDINVREKDADGNLKYKYYVLNSYSQVFKCLWNNKGAPSLEEPYFIPGHYNVDLNVFYTEVDGYTWKYMYTLPMAKIQKFLDEKWMPVLLSDQPDVYSEAEGCGGIEVIAVLDGGSGYNSVREPSISSAIIMGDGTGAAATVQVNNTTNTISRIVVTNPGKNYTYANVAINSTLGSGFKHVPLISSIGGNGSDVMSELGCDRIFVIGAFDETDTEIPNDLEIRQYGLISGIVSTESYPNHERSDTILAATTINVSPGSGTYERGEIVYQSTSSYANAYFSATCVDYNSTFNRLILSNVKGSYTIGASLSGKNTGTSRKILTATVSNIIKYSGRIMYVDNIEEVKRAEDSIELFKLLLKF